jgi:hypothetical protein
VRLTASRLAAETARVECAAANAKGVRRRLGQSTKRCLEYLRRLRTPAARRVLPARLVAELVEAGDAIRSELRTLRATVACPGDAA